MALLGGIGGRDSRAQTKRVTTSDAMSRAELAPSAGYNSTASLQGLAGFVPHLLGGPPSLDVPEGGHIIVYRFLELRLIPSGLLVCAVGPRASL